MKTPEKYTKLIKNNKITEEIISEVLFSFNKRAKNWRDKKREYQNNRYDTYHNYEKANEEEIKYYKYKSDILNKCFKPECIHKETKIYKGTEKVYDYEPEFSEVSTKDIIRKGKYFDDYHQEYVYFYVVPKIKRVELYFLYYNIGDRGFHEPIEEDDIKKYDIDVKPIDELETYGKDISELLSTQFCKKVYDKLMNDELEILNVTV